MAGIFKPIYARQNTGNLTSDRQRLAILQMMQKDPEMGIGYAIGSAIGNAYWGKKQAKSAAEAVNATEPGSDFRQANAALDQVGAAPTAAYNMSALDSFNNAPAGNVMYSPNITTPQQRGQAPVTPDNAGLLGGLKDPQETYQDMERQTTFNPGNTSLFTNGVRDLSNVVGGKQNSIPTLPVNGAGGQTGTPTVTQIVEQGAATFNQPFNAQKRMDDAIRYLMNKKGYGYEDAARLMSPYMSEWQQRQETETRQLADSLMQRLGSGGLSDADYKQNLVQLAQLGDYGRNAANIYGRDIVSGQDKWRAEQQQAAANQRFAQQQAINDRNNQVRMQLAQIRGVMTGNRGTGNRAQGNVAKSPLASEEFKYMANRLNEIGGIPEEERTAEQKQFFGTYKPLHDEIVQQSIGGQFGYYGATPQQANGAAGAATFNPNNYGQAVQKFQALANSGKYNRGDVESFIRQKYGLQPDDMSNDFVESIIKGIQW